MKFIFEKHVDEINKDAIIKTFLKKYKSLENLTQKVTAAKCKQPDYVDDYMRWRSIENIEFPIIEFVEIKGYDIFLAITPRRMELLEYIRAHKPDSIKQLAQALQRDYKNVYDDIKALAEYELIEILKEGKNKRPVCNITAISIAME